MQGLTRGASVVMVAAVSATAMAATPQEQLATSWTVKVMKVGQERIRAAEGQTWTFNPDGTYVRTQKGGEARKGKWSLTKTEQGQLQLKVSESGFEDAWFPTFKKGEMVWLSPPKTEKGRVVQPRRFAAFYHS